MEAFRLVKEKFADDLSGRGASLNGGRWNSRGVELFYTASNRSLAMAEVVVHMDLTNAPDDYQMVTIYVPDDVSVAIINSDNLPPNWNAYPAPAFDQNIGDQFVRDNRFCVLKIPSSVTQGDYNYLINPNHPEFSKIRILGKEKFPFDERIFK